MLFSRANLAAIEVAGKDPKLRALNGVHFEKDGSTVATNGKTLLAVGPVDEDRVHFPDVGEVAEPGVDGVTVPIDIVGQAMKNLPKDKRMSLQHVAMTRCEGKVEFTTTDMTKEQRVAGAAIRDKFPKWEATLRGAKEKASAGRVCVNRKDLIQLLSAIDKACPDKGDENPVFLEFGGEHDGIVLRSVNYETGQHAVGLAMPIDTIGQWLRLDDWERRIFRSNAKTFIGVRGKRGRSKGAKKKKS